MWSMKKMWSGSWLGRLVEARSKYQESRDLRFGESRYKNQESRGLLGSFALEENTENKGHFFRRLRPYYSPLTTLFVVILLFIACLSACNSDSKKVDNNQQYTCSMHPQIVENEPGSCPICGMDLTPIHNNSHTTHSVDSLLAKGKSINHNEETLVVKESAYTPEITMSGSVTHNTNQVKSISARVSGRIEKSYVKYNFEPIKKGQLLLKVYSPELVAIQQEMLYLKSKGDTDLLHKTKTKLSLLGVSISQINRILKTGKTDYTINIYSNYSGYLLNPNASNEDNLQQTNKPLEIREGQYINSGDLLFKVFNDNSLWAEFYINTLESKWLKTGEKLSLKINGQDLNSRIDFIQPFFKNNQNYKVIRTVLNNQNHQFKIGELATATAKGTPVNGIWIPVKSVYQSGEKNLVFIKKEGDLKPIEVQVSAKTENNFLIIKGLSSGDEIATNASYLTDSESFIYSK